MIQESPNSSTWRDCQTQPQDHMTIERIVQIHIATLTVIGAVLLGMGQQNLLLPVLILFAAVSSVVFTDTLSWFRLNRVMANLAALLALFFSLDDFFQADSRSQLLAIANLLTYLQIVLFYQRKNDRIYWQLAVLSLLQVMVSAALNVGIGFGGVLVLYAATAISTLGFFFLHRELSGVSPGRDTAGQRRLKRKRTKEKATQEDHWTRLLDRTPKPSPIAVAKRTSRRLIGWPFLQQLIVIGLTTMVFTLVLFFSAPRLDHAARQSMHVRTTHVVGFSPEVTLNELHRILQDSKPVMRVSLKSETTGRPYRVYNDVYFRGSVLTEYDVSSGVSRWRQRGSGKPFGSDLPEPLRGQANLLLERVAASVQRLDDWNLPEPPVGIDVIRQDILLEPIDESVLFSAYPVYQVADTRRDVRINPRTRQMFSRTRARGNIRSEYRYSIATTAFRAGLQVDVTPHDNQLRNLQDHLLLALEKVELLRFEPDRFPKLKAVADQVALAAGTQATRADIARALQNHLRDSTLYDYTLDFSQVQRDRELDPIEDFIANHRSGHCEYFASALVMMLRSQGIPARMVIGFKGGEYNELGDYYQLYQSDSHAWVEAYLEPEDVDRELPAGCDTGPAGGWMRLDPTPEDLEDDSQQLEQGIVDKMDDMLDYAQLLWADYILGLSASRQRESIYGPVADSTDPDIWSAAFQNLRSRGTRTIRMLGQFAFSLSGLMALCGVILAIIWVQIRVHRSPRKERRATPRGWLRRIRGLSRAGLNVNAVDVAFYSRLESILSKLGVARNSTQTPREFASTAERHLVALEFSANATVLPASIADTFYRVRFGGSRLDSGEAEAIARDLDGLEDETNLQLRIKGPTS